MSREIHVRFWERLGAKFPRSTHLQDYIYEGFGALLNKSRSANVGVVFSHQALGDLDKVSSAFRNVVLTNPNTKFVMRMNDPETCDHFANMFGTDTTTKITQKVKDGGETGDGSAREVERYKVHPNDIKALGTGYGIVSIPHPHGVKNIRIKFAMRENLPVESLPTIAKTPKPILFQPNGSEQGTHQAETELPG
jgi:type IV secretory pathway TraG/TraD family ATPase VirD4